SDATHGPRAAGHLDEGRHMIRRIYRLFATLALAGLLVAPPAMAAGPSDAELLSARTVGVMPVLATGATEGRAWARVAMAISAGERGAHGSLPGAVAVDLGGDEGFGFAGHADDADVRVLRFGYYLGLVPALT